MTHGIQKKTTAKSFHTHKTAQLTYTIEGVSYIIAANKLFIVPPGMAIFIPQEVAHKHDMKKDVVINSLYLPHRYLKFLKKEVQLIKLTELAKLLINKICTYDETRLNSVEYKRLLLVLMDELKNFDTVEYASLDLPENPKLVKIYHLFHSNPQRWPSNVEVAKYINVSTRTLLRLFKKETGMNFVVWKQKFRFIKAIELLQYYKNTSMVAYRLGYQSDSAFISMFKKMSGGKLPGDFK